MSWLRSSPLRQSLTRNNNNNNNPPFFSSSSNSHTSSTALRQRPIDTASDCDPRACYDSFCKHWQQAYDIIQRAQSNQKTPVQVGHDDVLGVVSHLDFMVTLLLVELHHCNKIALPGSDAPPPAPCLEYLLSENLLDKLYEWGCCTGRYANAVRLEQLKLYELLVSHSRHQLLCHEPFLRPLLKILASSLGEIYPPDLEKRLVILLNQLCVLLMQNVHLLDLFFFSAAQEQHKQNGNDTYRSGTSTNFIIFSLLIPYVHREGSLGHQARDALLLCMALSQKNSNIGTYIAQYSSMCPLLVTGLGGLYSRLPNSIEITAIDWHRITPDDVTEIPELMLFMNALEFCNAVVQVAHEMIKSQLLDFMYQGFIVPVLGPAVLQTLKGKHFQTNIESQISAMSYLDLILRSVTEPQLMRAFVKFLLDTEKFDGERILDTLIDRLSSNDANLSMVTMALFDTLLGLNCEDLMYELLLKFVLPGKHIPISHRHKINKVDPYINMTEYFLDLTPDVMKRARELTKHKQLGDQVASSGGPNAVAPIQPPLPSPVSTMSKTIGANWNYYGLHTGDSLYANFHSYLFDAHYRIMTCQSACSSWANTYKYQKWPNTKTSRSTLQMQEMVKQFLSECSISPLVLTKLQPTGGELQQLMDDGEKKQLDSLQSLGESSGYESFKWRPTDEDVEASESSSSAAAAQNCTISSTSDMEPDSSTSSGNSGGGAKAIKKESWRTSSVANDLLLTDLDFSEDLFAQGTVSLGPFINAVWAKLQTFTSNTLYVNLHLTGLITHLAWFPLPLIHSLLLRPDIIITSDTPSFHQVLRILKQQIDAELPVSEDSLEIIDIARSHLIDREFRLLNARKLTDGSPLHQSTKSPLPHHRLGQQTTFANISSASPVQVTPSSQYDPFKRNDSKRKSISKSITSMFSRKPNGSTSTSFTGAGSTTLASQQPSPASMNQTRETSLSTTPGGSDRISGGSSNTSQTYSTSSSLVNSSSMNSTGSTTTLSTLSAGTSVSTLLGGLSSSNNAGVNSEPVSLDSLTSSLGALANTSGTERTRDLALCAVLLDEWLKELAAVAQEQSVVMINADAWRHRS